MKLICTVHLYPAGVHASMSRTPETVSAADRICGKAETGSCGKRVKKKRDPDIQEDIGINHQFHILSEMR